MKRWIFAATLVLAGLVLPSTLAFAHAPTITITGPTGTLSFASFPQTVDVTGTVDHGDPGVIDAVHDLTLTVNGSVVSGSESPFAGSGNSTTAGFSLPWLIFGPGTYTLQVSARHGNDTGTDDETVIVAQLQVVVTECPAAPSVAAKLLNAAGVKSGSPSYKNYVSQVAQHMGPQTMFDGVGACDTAAYRAAVRSYLQGLGAAV